MKLSEETNCSQHVVLLWLWLEHAWPGCLTRGLPPKAPFLPSILNGEDVPKFAKLHRSNSSFVKFVSTTCNYYERGRKAYLYASMLFKTQPTDHYMHWLPQNCCYLFIYKMPMHRKGVRLKS